MASNPRDFRDWMKQVERQGVQLRGIPTMISQSVEVIVEDIEKDKVRHPAAPIELTFQTAFYLDSMSSRTRVRFIMDFPDVVFHTDGTPAQIQQYELWAKEETASALELTTSAVPNLALPGATLPSLTNTTTNAAIAAQEKPWALKDTNTASFFRTDGFIPGSVWRFRARAIGTTTVTPGEWSEDLVVQMLADTSPPPQPTAPKLLVQRGTITVSWDGQSVGGPMPADFKYAILAHGTSSSPTFEIARFGRVGGFKVVADIDYYDPQFFRLAAVDESGNVGPWSEQGVGYTTPLVDKDVILSTIDAAKTHLKNIDAGVSILENTIITEHLVVTEEMTAAIANFLYIRADKIDVNSLAADEVFTGLLDAVLVRADMFEGKEFFGGVFTGGTFQTSVEEYAGIKLDPETGFQSYNYFGQLQFDVSATGATFTGKVTSGFDPDLQAVLSDSVFSNQPGVQFNIGLFDSVQPFITGWATNNDFPWGEGMLHMSSGRTAFDPPAEIFLTRNGTWQIGKELARIYSAGNFLELIRDDSYLRMHGDYTSLWYGSAVGGGEAFVTQTFGHTLIHSAGIDMEGSVTVQGSLGVTGSKNFIMDHPTKPGKLLIHGSTESPVSGVEYWGCGTLGADGSDVFHLPEYFTALVKADSPCVSVYGNGAVVGWGAIVDNSVTVTGPAGTQYSWLVKAERTGGDFEVERDQPAPSEIAGPSAP